MRENIISKNKELVKQNLYSDQVSFDYGEWFIKLAFMEDDEISEIAKACGLDIPYSSALSAKQSLVDMTLCPNCGTLWEDERAVLHCPCLDA